MEGGQGGGEDGEVLGGEGEGEVLVYASDCAEEEDGSVGVGG